jgi:hypothetical protein
MLLQPDVAWVVGEGHVVGGAEVPLALRVHQEGDVLRVVVVIARDGIEAHAAEELHGGGVREAQLAHHSEGHLVAVGQRIVVVKVRDAAERGHVQLMHDAFGVEHPVEALRKEVRAAVLFQQPTGHHLHTACARHQVVGVFDATEAFRIAELIGGDAIELDQAVGETLQPVDLPAAHLTRFRIERNDRLRPRAARRGAHLDDVAQRLFLSPCSCAWS